MNSYSNTSRITGKATGKSGYSYDEESIVIHFTTGSIYTYTYESCGVEHIEKMKLLADSQEGLNTYVTKNKPPFSSKN